MADAPKSPETRFTAQAVQARSMENLNKGRPMDINSALANRNKGTPQVRPLNSAIQPENPSRREFLKNSAAVVGLTAAGGAGLVATTTSEQRAGFLRKFIGVIKKPFQKANKPEPGDVLSKPLPEEEVETRDMLWNSRDARAKQAKEESDEIRNTPTATATSTKIPADSGAPETFEEAKDFVPNTGKPKP